MRETKVEVVGRGEAGHAGDRRRRGGYNKQGEVESNDALWRPRIGTAEEKKKERAIWQN